MILDDDNRLIIGKGVKLNPYKPRTFLPREYLTEHEIRNSTHLDLILDTEAYPNYFMVGFKIGDKYFKLNGDFNPHILCWMLMSYRSIGFNSINYDLPILWASYYNRDPEYLKDVSNALIFTDKRPQEVAKDFNFKIYSLQPKQHIDLINVCPLRGSLKLYGARLHAPRLQELPYPDTQYLNEQEKEIVTEYNCNDLDLTHIIKDFCKERIQLREALSIDYDEDLMSKSDAQMAEAVIPKEVAKLNGKWAKRPTIEPGTTYRYACPHYIRYATKPMQDLLAKIKRTDFVVQPNGRMSAIDATVQIGNKFYSLGIGGLHSKDKCSKYEANDNYEIVDIDVVSYYPNAILNMKLCPVALGPNFLTVYAKFKSDRVEAKRLKIFTKDKGLKIFLNGVSGKLSDVWSKMYSPGHTIQMNVTGQLLILMLAEIFTLNGIEVISANTDGITVYSKKAERDKLQYWIKFWEKETNFEMEQVEYKGFYARDVNAYFAVKTNGEVKVKGPYSEVGSQSGTQLDNNPIMLICSDAIKQLLANSIPIEQTIRDCKDITRFVTVRQVKGGAHKNGDYLGKVVRYAYYKKVTGTINYVLTGNKVPDTDGAMPLQDLPDEFPADKIDYDRYIRETQNILYDIGYYERPKQVSFF